MFGIVVAVVRKKNVRYLFSIPLKKNQYISNPFLNNEIVCF